MLGAMDTKSSAERDHLLDLESGRNAAIDELEGGTRQSDISNGQGERVLNRVWSGFVGIDGLVKGEGTGAGKTGHTMSTFAELPGTNVEVLPERNSVDEDRATLLEKKPGAEKPKKKSCKKPPRPPRPPKSLPLDAADQKLLKELSELAMLKRARIERMKKKLKSTKSTSSSSNLCGWIITVLFCLVILWQGFFPQGVSSVNFHGSPESSVQKRSGLITIQFNNNMSRYAPQSSYSASPSNMEPASEMGSIHGRKLGRTMRKF